MLKPNTNQKLTLQELIAALYQSRIISTKQQQQMLAAPLSRDDQDKHPLILIAAQNFRSITRPAYELTLEQLTKWLAAECGQPYFRVDPLKTDVAEITRLVSQAYASKLQILPVEINAYELTVATCEPWITHWEHELARISQRQIKRVIINPRDVTRYLIEFYGVSKTIMGAVSDTATRSLNEIQNFESLVEVGRIEPDANDRHIVSLVDWLLQFAFEQRASDIHLEPRREQGKVRFRIDGVLHQVHEFPIKLMGAITSRLKTLGRMDVTDKRRPQDGRVKTLTPNGTEVEMRLSTMPTTFGEKLVLRIFDPDMLMKSLHELGFTKHDHTCWQGLIANPHGILLVTGPTGSGKTTTLYSTLKQIARPDINVCTIEDPIELVDPHFNQMQVQPQLDIGFATGVRTLLRQDPDVIMVGEIRDRETAEVAVQAALTGHRVLSSLHTNNAPATIIRLLDLGTQPYLISATLLGIIAQRLLRTLCPLCKTKTNLDRQAWADLVYPYKTRAPKTVYTSRGCDDCRGTGYQGRIGIYETLVIDNPIRRLITRSAELEEIQQAASKQGMRSLALSGAQKVADGYTSLEEVYATLATHRDEEDT